MDMNSEQESVEHVTVDKDDEAASLCEMEESLELTGTCSTGNVTVTATAYYERDVDIEEFLRDTPEPTNYELTTQDSVEDFTNGLNTMELQNNLEIEERKTLEKISEMERNKEMLSVIKEQIRTMLRLILNRLKDTKYHFDKVETLTWIPSDITVHMGKWEKEWLEHEYEVWKELSKTLNNDWKWDEYKKTLEDCSEDFEEEDWEIMKECKRLETYLEAKRKKLLETGEEKFRKAGIDI